MFQFLKRKSEIPEIKEIAYATTPQEIAAMISGQSSTAAGISVTPRKALKCTVYFSAVRNLAEGVAKLPQILNKRDEDGEGWIRAKDHSLYNILRYKWNRSLSAFDAKAMLIMHLMLYGNFFAKKVWTGSVRNKDAKIRELHPLMPWAVEIKQASDLSIYYVHTQADGSKKTYSADEIFHVRYFTLDGISSMSPIDSLAESIALMMSADKFASLNFANGAHPGGAITSKKKIDTDTKDWLRSQINAKFSGDNAFRLMLLDDEMDYKQMSLSAGDSQLNETRMGERTALAAGIGVAPHSIGELTRATHNNIEAQQQEKYSDTLLPLLERIDQKVKIDLLWDWEFEDYKSEHLLDAILRADIEKRFKAYQVAHLIGVLNADEIRAKEGLNARADGNGHTYFEQLNMGASGDGKTPPDDEAKWLNELYQKAKLNGKNGNGALTN